MPINYLYFGIYFLFINALCLFSNLPPLFMFYGFAQASLEVCALLLLAYFLRNRALAFPFFIAISFAFMVIHFIQFTIARVMDADVLYILKFFFGSGLEHLIAGFQAMNLNWTMIASIVLVFCLFPVVGIFLYNTTLKICEQKKLILSSKQMLLGLSVSLAVLITLDWSLSSSFNKKHHERFKKSLPLGTTLASPPTALLPLTAQIKDVPKEKDISLPSLEITHRPNLYFFIVETFRKDYLDAAPNLSNFGKEHIAFKDSFSNTNSTGPSWYALFHANIPLRWISVRDCWEKGSLQLRYLKNLGYKIHVYSAADLRFFGMDRLIFGSNRELADEIIEYSSDRTIEPCDRDALAIKELQKHKERSGQAYFVFLDSTHSEYSFPKDFPLRYTPISEEINYLTISPKSPDLELLKNRYRNAISYVDSLFGECFDFLKKENLFDSSIISITGDHAEEFFEEGGLFHGTHLNSYQTSVPIFMKFPSKEWVPQTTMATHIDLFPSILHYLTKQSDFSSLCDGTSIFRFDLNRKRVAVLNNGASDPNEFLVDGEFHARLHGNELEILKGTLEAGMLDFLLQKGPDGPSEGRN